MKHLWAPWRIGYVSALRRKPKGCVFCRMIREKKDARNFIITRTKHSFAVLNLYPYNNGHVLIVPNKHADDLAKLTGVEKKDLLELFESTKLLLDKVLRPHGYNVGINIGRSAGAGFPGHIHIRVVPRWGGDVNFMPVTAATKVVSQSLTMLYKLLSHAHQKRNRRSRK